MRSITKLALKCDICKMQIAVYVEDSNPAPADTLPECIRLIDIVNVSLREIQKMVTALSLYPCATSFMFYCCEFKSMDWFSFFPQITELVISDCTDVHNVSFLSRLPKLEGVHLIDLTLDSLEPIRDHPTLKKVCIPWCRVPSIKALESIKSLERVVMPELFGGDVTCLKRVQEILFRCPCYYLTADGQRIKLSSASRLYTGEQLLERAADMSII